MRAFPKMVGRPKANKTEGLSNLLMEGWVNKEREAMKVQWVAVPNFSYCFRVWAFLLLGSSSSSPHGGFVGKIGINQLIKFCIHGCNHF